MSEPQTNIEIEDVLSSIRRLVSQDHRRPPALIREAAGEAPNREATAPVVEAPEASPAAPQDAPAFVLSEALRVDEPQDDAAADATRAQADALEADASFIEPPLATPEGTARDEDGGRVQNLTGHPSRDVAPETVDLAPQSPAEQQVEWEQPVDDIFSDSYGVPDLTASAEGARDSVETAASFDPFVINDGAPIPTAPPKSQDLGAELSQIEGSLAQLEASFAKPTPTFEPELGDPFGVNALPDSFEAAEWVDADEATFVEGDEYVLEATEVPEADYHEDATAAHVSAEAIADHADSLAGAEHHDADLGHEAWAAEAGALGFTAEDEAERDREAALAQSRVHRLHLSDAVHHAPAHEPRRTTYEDICDDASLEPEDMLERDSVPAVLDGLDEEVLRTLVRDLIRQELQGVLGERITRNVRKLVRREIQRALASENFE